MSSESDQITNKSPHWKRLGQKRIQQHAEKSEQEKQSDFLTVPEWMKRPFRGLRNIAANVFLSLVHISARLTNRPIVDIGQKYSVSTLNERIDMLEEVLIKQWTNYKDEDFLTPNEEIRQYISACHVARQYERITPELLVARLGVSQSKAELLIDHMVSDEIVTESYTVTYHDVRRRAVDEVIERSISSLKKTSPTETTSQPSSDKKH